ncbi:MAG: glycosyltransferase family 4 protein [Ardenticatenales bacterium]|nr:glycosyltransferase family 4 protein [Ardenticatenales bacterium]MCB9172629.1 glycosyltransferase family 4 protein [Ardenticatenales bacterium]
MFTQTQINSFKSDANVFEMPTRTALETMDGSLAADHAVNQRDLLMIAPTMFFADYGSHVRILEESLSLRNLGHRLRILAYPNGNDIAGLEVRRCLGVPFNRRVVVGSSRHRFYLDTMLALKSLSEVLRHPPELIHAHLHEGALIGSVLGTLRRRPVLFDFQGSLVAEMLDHGFLRPGGKRERTFHQIEQIIDRWPSAIITSSSHAADLLINKFSISSRKVFPILDSVNTDSFRPPQPDDSRRLAELRQRLDIPADRTLVVYLGLLAEHQGTTVLLEAAAQLLQKRRDLHFLIMGFPNEPRYRALAHQLGITAHVTFTGRVPYEQAGLHLQLGDVAVAPKMSSTEGCGKLLNYMAVGLPTVAFNTPVSKEYLGEHGVFAHEMSSRAFATALSALLAEPSAWPDMGRALRKRAKQRFSWQDAGHHISEIYDIICDS